MSVFLERHKRNLQLHIEGPGGSGLAALPFAPGPVSTALIYLFIYRRRQWTGAAIGPKEEHAHPLHGPPEDFLGPSTCQKEEAGLTIPMRFEERRKD